MALNHITKANLRDAFTYHPIESDAQRMAYEAVTEAAIAMGNVILNVVPPGKAQQDALWLLSDLRMKANQGIATAGVGRPPQPMDLLGIQESSADTEASAAGGRVFEPKSHRPCPCGRGHGHDRT